MKRFFINLGIILTSFIIYFLQENFFNWFTIAGVMPNIFVILILFIGLFTGKNKGTIYGMIIGAFLDFFVGNKLGINIISLGLVGLMAGIFAKNFSKDSRMTIMLMVAGLTFGYETISYLLNYLILDSNLEILLFLKISIIEVIYNIIITIIIYPLIKKFGYYLEYEYKGSKILTRYF